jgi:hypothetical protein
MGQQLHNMTVYLSLHLANPDIFFLSAALSYLQPPFFRNSSSPNPLVGGELSEWLFVDEF